MGSITCRCLNIIDTNQSPNDAAFYLASEPVVYDLDDETFPASPTLLQRLMRNPGNIQGLMCPKCLRLMVTVDDYDTHFAYRLEDDVRSDVVEQIRAFWDIADDGPPAR